MVKKKSLIQYIKLPKIEDDCILCVAQSDAQIPFKIERVYYILKASIKQARGFHAHHKNIQALFCIQGRIKITLDNGEEKDEIVLKDPNIGVLIPNLVWHEMHGFKKDTILLVLASEKFAEEDYIRNYDQFLSLVDR